MTEEIKQSSVDLHRELTDLQGEKFLNQSKEKRTPEELSKLSRDQIRAVLPAMTLGEALSITLGNKHDCENMAESAKFHRLLAKVNNKNMTGSGEWKADKIELKDLKDCLDSIKPIPNQFGLSVVLHGQIYNMIDEYLLKVLS